jgi:membrane-associated phospholipid phosphatase
MYEPKHNHLRALFLCLVAVALAILFVDRPASTWSHAHLQGIAFFDELTHIVDVVRWAAPAGLLLAGVAVCAGWRPGSKGMTLIATCLSVATAYEAKECLKRAFGRTWPETWVAKNPSWIHDGAFGFHPFHGQEGWFSFPSGHMTVMAAMAAALWSRVPSLRWAWVTLAGLVALGLYGCDYHFVGDMLAGTFLGIASAKGVLALLFRK